jgi:outer membrane biogenesis lipoprotein LolB
MRFKLTMLCAATLLLAGCSKTTGIGGINACDFWRPVSWSQKDTPQTVAEVKGNNARRKAWCD